MGHSVPVQNAHYRKAKRQKLAAGVARKVSAAFGDERGGWTAGPGSGGVGKALLQAPAATAAPCGAEGMAHFFAMMQQMLAMQNTTK